MKAQPSPRFRHLAVTDGLSQSHIYAILQDDVGFMWFATWEGLNRWDGYRFTVLKHDPSDLNSLRSNHIHDLLQDRDGLIWIATHGAGASAYDPVTDTFTHYWHNPDDPYSLSGNSVMGLCQDSEGCLWLGTGHNGLNRFDPQSGQFVHYWHDPENPHSFNGGSVMDIVADPSGDLWVSTLQPAPGIDRLDPRTGRFVHYVPGTIANKLHVDARGDLWAGTSRGLYGYDRATDRFVRYLPDPTQADHHVEVTCVCEGVGGTIWVGTMFDGLYAFDRRSRKFSHHYQYSPARPDGLSSNWIWSLYKDRAGLLWVGTRDAGLNVLDYRCDQFQHYQHDPAQVNSLADNPVQAIWEDREGLLWLGTQRGALDCLDRTTGQFTHYVSGLNRVDAICEDREGRLWFGGRGESGLNCLDKETGELQSYRCGAGEDDAYGRGAHDITYIYEDRSGVLWVGIASRGLNRLDRTTGEFSAYRHDPDDPHSLGDDDVSAIYEDSSGDLWVGSFASLLSRLDRERGRFHVYRHDPENPGSLALGNVFAIHEDAVGTLWVGMSSGLCRFDRQSETFVHYTEQDGLPSSNIEGILEDDHGRLWLSTKKGLSRFDPRDGVFRNYDVTDGLQDDEFCRAACFRGRNGEMYFGGSGGFNVFHPDAVLDNPYAPPVVITNLLLFNRPVPIGGDSPLRKAVWATQEVVLGPEDYVFALEFSSLCYAAPEKNRYRYRLEGFDRDWNEVSAERRFASYSNLPAGKYVFRVMGSNNHGVWNREGASLQIGIEQPLWERLEAEKRAADLARASAESANQAKSQFLASMSHELRTPLNAILGFAELTARDTQLSAEARRNLGIIRRSGEHLLELINDVLNLAKVEAGKMTLDQTSFDLYRLIEDLEDTFRLRAEAKGLQLLVACEPDVPRYVRADEGKLRQVLINLLDNAVKFTEESKVELRVARFVGAKTQRLRATRLRFVVTDTGPGIPSQELETIFEAFVQTDLGRRSQEGTGLGLTISQRFVQLMGGEIAVHSEVGRGTSFEFDIPVGPASAGDVLPRQSERRVVGLTSGTPRYRILVADDRWSSRQFLTRLHERLGFRVREAENGEQAVELWQLWQPHLIWMDLRMPVLDGYEAAKRIRSWATEIASQAEPVIIAFTAGGLEEERVAAALAVCDDLLRKPIRAADVFEVLAKHLDVQFVHEQRGRQEEAPGLSLVGMAEKWLADMHQATIEGDLDWLAQLVQQIQTTHPALAEELFRLADNFEHLKILGLVQEAMEDSP